MGILTFFKKDPTVSGHTSFPYEGSGGSNLGLNYFRIFCRLCGRR